jgi:hypothetical protein
MGTIGREVGRGCGRSAIVYAIAVIIMFCLFGTLVLLPLFYVMSNDSASIWYLIIPLMLFFVILTGGGVGALIWVRLARQRTLDAAFTPWGLEGSNYLMTYRQYHGPVQGRQVDAYYYRGPILDIDIQTSLKTRLGITGRQGDTIFLAKLAGRAPMQLPPELGDLTAFPSDEAWARDLMNDPQAVEILRRLTTLNGDFSRQQILLRPGTLRLQLSGSRKMLTFTANFTPQQLQSWLQDLLALVKIMESLPAPRIEEEISAADNVSRQIRKVNWLLVGLLIGGGVMVFAVGGGLLLAWLLSSF